MDLFILFLLATEFLIIILFLLISLCYNFNTNMFYLTKKSFFFFYLINLIIYLSAVPMANSTFQQQYLAIFIQCYEIFNNDLFIYFYFFFINFSLAVIYLTLILSFFSIVFI